MPVEITMPQLSDTMTEGTLVKWLKKEGDKIKPGEIVAEVETDKATMEMESFDGGTLAHIVVKEGGKVAVGAAVAVLATSKENPAEIKAKYASGAVSKPVAVASATPAPIPAPPKPLNPAPPVPMKSTPATAPVVAKPPTAAKNYAFDIIVIGGGPAGYAAAIRAGQLKKRVLCIEKENLGGTCLNWGCIPTKALLEDGAFVRKIRTEAEHRGITVGEVKVDFSKVIGRSRAIAGKLSGGIAHLFKKYEVKHEIATAQILGAHRVKYVGKEGAKEVSAEHIIIATGAKPTQLPFAPFDGQKIITSREAMNLPKQPKKIAIIGAGAIGCEFADFYSSMGTEVVIIEMLDHLLPIEDTDVSVLLERLFAKRNIDVRLKTKTDKIEKTDTGVKLTLSGEKPGIVEADLVLVAVGVTGNTEGLAAPESGLGIDRSRVKVNDKYHTNLENVWAVGDCITMNGTRHPDLAHVAHHEAILCVESICGHAVHEIDYQFIPGCTYTHPQVASMGYTERRAREEKREIRIGKFPFQASGRALAAGEPDGFVKLIFDAKYGELLGAHLIGETVTELLSELVLARKLEATEAEIIETMHPHPTMSEAVMEAAGVAVGRAIHL